MRAVGESLGLGRTFPEAFLKALDGRERAPPTLRLSPARRAGARALGPPARGGAQRLDLPGIHPYFADELRDVARGEALRASREALRIARPCSASRARGARSAACPAGSPSTRAPRSSRRRRRTSTSRTKPSDDRPEPTGRAVDRARLRAEPDRPGDRVRLLLRPRGAGASASSATRPCSSTRTRRRCRPTTTRPTGSTSSRSRSSARSTCARSSSRSAWSCRSAGRRRSRLAPGLADAGVPLLGDPLAAIDARRGPRPLRALLDELGLRAPRWGDGRHTRAEARAVAEEHRLPGARPAAPRDRRPRHARRAHAPTSSTSTSPCLVDQFLEGALELDVDVLCDGERRVGRGDPRARRAGRRPLGRLAPASPGAVRDARRSRPRSASSRPRLAAGSARAACSTSSSRCTTASSTCSRRTRAPRARCRSSRRRRACRSSSTRAGCCSARRWRELDLPGAGDPHARLGEGGGVPGRPLRRRRRRAAPRCARPAR